VYAVKGVDLDTVIVDGKVLLRDRRFTRADAEDVMAKARALAERIRANRRAN